MSVRLPIPKLAASAVAPLTVTPNFSNALLKPSANWPQDVNYLRDTYATIYEIWERLKEPHQDQELFTETDPKLRELVIGLTDVSKELASRGDIARDVVNAKHDADVAGSYGNAGDYGMATVYQAYALTKLHRVLTVLINDINTSRKRGSREKLAYGYDTSGEVQEQGGTSGRDQNLWDQGNQNKMDKTPPNPVSVAQDFEAEEEFPELAEIKHKWVSFPPRTR